MKPVSLELKTDSPTPLYMQLYNYLREEITAGRLAAGERLPSLRLLSKDLGISVTTVETAYSQFLVEGYVKSRPQSGYYVAEIGSDSDFPPGISREPLNFDTDRDRKSVV